MRQRFIKNALEKIQTNRAYFIENPSEYKGNWQSVFGNDNPIRIEIGMGKGKFLTELASLNPNINYIGIEKVTSVLLRSSQKLEQLELKNIKIINVDAINLTDYFDDGEIDLIYLNFSDPWPKNCHMKRRLTYHKFLDVYKKIIKKDGWIYFKTDNQGLFEFSLEELNNYGMILTNISLDLHNSNFDGNITTEYEDKFSTKGPIYRLEAKFR